MLLLDVLVLDGLKKMNVRGLPTTDAGQSQFLTPRPSVNARQGQLGLRAQIPV
jgi:hypothetical protein